ncbi:MAG: prepilin peptidase [Slackia sp.]|nr:prepilin peptidase [Slackia sp.]
MELFFDIPLAVLPQSCAMLASAAFVLVLVWSSIVDIKRRIVPGGAIAVLLAVWTLVFGAAFLACGDASVWRSGVLAGAIGAAVASTFAFSCGWLLSRMRKRTALGFGDVKLLFVFGLYCGVAGTLACLFAACVLAAFYSIVRFFVDACVRLVPDCRPLRCLRRIPPFDGTFPFVPFLATSFLFLAFLRLPL